MIVKHLLLLDHKFEWDRVRVNDNGKSRKWERVDRRLAHMMAYELVQKPDPGFETPVII